LPTDWLQGLDERKARYINDKDRRSFQVEKYAKKSGCPISKKLGLKEEKAETERVSRITTAGFRRTRLKWYPDQSYPATLGEHAETLYAIFPQSQGIVNRFELVTGSDQWERVKDPTSRSFLIIFSHSRNLLLATTRGGKV